MKHQHREIGNLRNVELGEACGREAGRTGLLQRMTRRVARLRIGAMAGLSRRDFSGSRGCQPARLHRHRGLAEEQEPARDTR